MIELPSKYDIVPIHASDISNYMRCRRYWDWSSPARNNLRHKVGIFGINVPLWMGTGIHYALEQYYNPALQRDPSETWLSWFELQWAGGDISDKELELTYDANPIELGQEGDGRDSGPFYYRVKGLRDLLPTQADEEFAGYRELGFEMMKFYKGYAERNDDFEVVAAESSFSIPLGFEVIDIREQSPNYGKKLEVHARGKRDAIVFRPAVNRYGIIDHKTAAGIPDDYFRKLDKDPQLTTYLWASQKEAEIHGFPWVDVQDAVMQAINKTYPKPPTVLKNGWQPSISRAEESTTATMFSDYIVENQLTKWFEENEKAQSYYNWLVAEGDRVFIQREVTRRNKYEIAAQDKHIKMIAQEMLDAPNIYPNPTSNWLCLNCQFRPPCLAADDGSDWQGMLVDGFERNKDR